MQRREALIPEADKQASVGGKVLSSAVEQLEGLQEVIESAAAPTGIRKLFKIPEIRLGRGATGTTANLIRYEAYLERRLFRLINELRGLQINRVRAA